MQFTFTRSPCRLLAVAIAVTLLAGGTAQAASASAATPQSHETLWSLALKGGVVMYPLGLCSLLALGISIERAVSLRRKKIIPEGFLAGVKEKLQGRPDDIAAAVALCDSSNSPAGNVLKGGLVNIGRGDDLVEKGIEDAGAREAERMKGSLRGLGMIISISPLLGLLGTVYGMIAAFETSTQVGSGKADLLARGIYEALVTTAAGLTIAIPAVVIHHFLSTRIDARIDEFEEMGIEFLTHCASRKITPKVEVPPLESIMRKGTW